MRLPCPVRIGACLLSLTLGVVLGVTPARSQLVVEPSSLAVTVPQSETETRTVTLTNSGGEAISFCLNFERPLQRGGAAVRLSEDAVGGACGPLGEVVLYIDRESVPAWDPFGLAMTPDGRLFAADNNGGDTYELTPSLEVTRTFEHPFVDELDTFPATQGVTYNADTGTLWWLNVEQQGSAATPRGLLLEGDLDGNATGRRIALPRTAGDPPERLFPFGVSYDGAANRYYFTGYNLEEDSTTLWAVDTLGAVISGYPIVQDAYPGANFTGPDAHGSTSEEAEAIRIELAVALPGAMVDRFIVVDPEGRDLGIETPLPDVSGDGGGGSSIQGEPLRSRVDPNGVLYFPFTIFFETLGIVGIRPHPLPPSWLVVEAWDGTLAPGESVEVALTFRPGQRSVGDYTAVLQAFDAETGAALEVLLSLTVTQGTDAEGETAAPDAVSLSVYPNPNAGPSTVELTLPEAAEVSVVVYDVLGRRVASLAEGRFETGTHRFRFDPTRLPSGLYLVRAEVGGAATARAFTERLTVVK